MATVTCELEIESSTSLNGNSTGRVITNSERLKKKIEDLGYTLVPMALGTYHLCTIVESEGSNKMEAVRDAVLSEGFNEVKTSIIPKADRRSCFAFKYWRKFTKQDIKQAEYLCLKIKVNKEIIADYAHTSPEGYVLKVSNRLRSKLDIGWLDIVLALYVSEMGREQLQGGNFTGIHFEPAIYDQPEKYKEIKQLYQLTSTLTMPSCLLPILNKDGEIVDEHWKEGGTRAWNDGGYIQPILKYRREEVAAMGAFDIAKTRETTGFNPRLYRHQYIVSQRFREYLEELKVRTVEFVPVELV